MRRRLAILAIIGATVPAIAPVHADSTRVAHHDPTQLPALGRADALLAFEVYLPPHAGMPGLLTTLQRWVKSHPARLRLIFKPVANYTDQIDAATALWAGLDANGDVNFQGLADPRATRAALLAPTAIHQLSVATLTASLDHPARRAMVRTHSAVWERFSNRSHALIMMGDQRMVAPPNVTLEALDRFYETIYQRAKVLRERGASQATLPQAISQQFAEQMPMPPPSARVPESLGDQVLPPGALAPVIDVPFALQASFADSDDTAPPIVTALCDPKDPGCGYLLTQLIEQSRRQALMVRWLPLYNRRYEASATIADASLCASELGYGKAWLTALARSSSAGAFRGRSKPFDVVLDDMAAQIGIASSSFWYCRAVMAGTASRLAARFIAAGVRQYPSLLIAGRVYPAVHTADLTRLLLAFARPGWLERLAPSWADLERTWM